MKLCFVKQRYMPEYTWSTTLWKEHTPDSILDNFILRSKNLGAIYELQADVWVVEDGPHKTGVHQMLEEIHPIGLKALYKVQPASRWADVPWSDYDVVISIDSLLTDSLMSQYPETLWCYYAGEHQAPEYKKSCRSPLRGYDVFMDHVLHVKMPALSKLPLSIPFPALVSRQAFAVVLGDIPKDTACFLDSRALRKEANPKGKLKELRRVLKMPIKQPDVWNYSQSYLEAANRNIMSPRNYLARMGCCKYFALMRGGEFVGQASIEAAALGCIVLSGSGSYPNLLCHPTARMNPVNFNEAVKGIQKIEGSPDLQSEILEHQNVQLERFFWREPMALLEKLINLKRRSL